MPTPVRDGAGSGMALTFGAVLARARELRRDRRDKRRWLAEAAQMDQPEGRIDRYELCRRYYRGEHRVQLMEREREYLQASGIPYCENYCKTIVDTHASRLAVRGFGGDKELARFGRELWIENEMDAAQSRIHRGAVKLGDYFLLIDPPELDANDRPQTLPLLCPTEPDEFKLVYDSGYPLYGVKVWTTKRKGPQNPQGRRMRRMNVYWPDSIEYWWTPASSGGDWAGWFLGSEDEGNERPWTMDGTWDGEPIGIPAVHFADYPDPHYGWPMLLGAIPQQDGLNKSLVDVFWVMDAQGWPQQWGSGVDPKKLQRHPGSLWTTPAENARFGQLDPADPARSVGKIESDIRRMAARAHMPLHLMLAGVTLPSGESLKTSESGLVMVTRADRQIPWGHKHIEAVKLAARIERAFGATNPPVDGRLTVNWERAETRQEVDEANTAVLWKALGVSETTVLERLGFDPERERENRSTEGTAGGAADELLRRARDMQGDATGTIPQAPTRSEELGGGRQPAQRPARRRTRVAT